MIEITGNDISELSDKELRSLIGLLCEAELSAVNLPTAGVTWGGHQNASDGGIDVRIELTTLLHNDSFIPKSNTCFQVKKPDMPRSAIIEEMRPNGELRQVIKDLADVNGAYIIVSSQGSTADSSLRNRKIAMQDAMRDYEIASQIKVDFYDRERIAGWVRTHPAIILWVRDKVGRPIQGWMAYGNWANCPGGIEEAYITDDQVRLYNARNSNSLGHNVLDGINELRNTLRRPSSSVRLVGLSGVGKTRLLQSLFDDRIGEKSLNRSQVIYTDMGNSPIPDPRNFAERLISLQKSLILVIDNCPPEMHRRLTSVCSASGSSISLITVEYDVRDDQPEETEVFYLEPASNDLIEKVILARFVHISEVGARIISEFSGGNARIAITLAKTVERGEDISRLRDNELFHRLFQQRNNHDSKLLKVAEVCSLVYSFNSRAGEIDNNELSLLGSLINMSVLELYENVSELKRRDLIQQRSHWRAILPHAVANRLAVRALENIPPDTIASVFQNGDSQRLLLSFSRRLSYLHNCQTAKEIASDWLSSNGILGDLLNLNHLGISLLRNIAPVDPELILYCIEDIAQLEGTEVFFSRENNHYTEFTRLLRSIAYDPELFERSTQLLCRFAISERLGENQNSIRRLLESLFHIYLSGTHASPEQRQSVMSSFLESDSEGHVMLGISLLSASLESLHFSSHYEFQFGARTRDFGYSPKNRDDQKNWYNVFLNYAITLAISGKPVAYKIKAILAKKFRDLWTNVAMDDELEVMAKSLIAKDAWVEGWVAVKNTLKYGEKMSVDKISRLNTLADLLKPTNLVDRIKLFALSDHDIFYDLYDIYDYEEEQVIDRTNTLEEITRELGREIGSQTDVLYSLLPELLSNHSNGLFTLGQGLAEGCSSPSNMWDIILQQLESVTESKRNYQLERGFINGISKIHPCLCNDILNAAVTDKTLAPVYPIMETSIVINAEGVVRLKNALKLGIAPIQLYVYLGYGRTLDSISEKDFCELLKLISSNSEGTVIAIEILNLWFHGKKVDNICKEIVTLGQELLLQYSFYQKNAFQIDYRIAYIFKKCFASKSAEMNARLIAIKLAESLMNNEIYFSDYDHTLNSLASLHPIVFLDVFIGDQDNLNYKIARIFSDDIDISKNPLSSIDDKLIITWCNDNAKLRYPIIASLIVPYINLDTKIQWSTLALTMIGDAQDPVIVLNNLKSSLRPTTWSGSRSEIMKNRMPLIISLKEFEYPIISEWAKQEEVAFSKEIRFEHERELKEDKEDKQRNEQFEY